MAIETPRATDGRAGEPAAPRHGWVDTAKGIAIILVVLYHAIIFTAEAGFESRWSSIAATLGTFRMPLFFFTAGVFAAKAVGLGFRDLFTRRLLRLLWIYVLWSLVWIAAVTAVPALRAGGGPTALESLVALPVLPNPNTWFVYALAVYFVVAWLLRRLPVWLQLLPAAVLTVLFETDALRTGNGPLDKMATYFTFFLLAVRIGPVVLRLAPRLRPWHALVLVAVYAGGTAAAAALSLFYVPGVQLLLSCCAVAAGVAASVLLGRLAALGWLARLGTRTLPVYVLHFYPILAITALLRALPDASSAVALALPPVLTVVAVVVSLIVHRYTRGVPGLYGLPPGLQVARG